MNKAKKEIEMVQVRATRYASNRWILNTISPTDMLESHSGLHLKQGQPSHNGV